MNDMKKFLGLINLRLKFIRRIKNNHKWNCLFKQNDLFASCNYTTHNTPTLLLIVIHVWNKKKNEKLTTDKSKNKRNKIIENIQEEEISDEEKTDEEEKDELNKYFFVTWNP